MTLRPGDRLGSYEIIQPIGAGGMGEVHRARHVKLRRDVAIKVLPAEVATNPWRRSRFEREARTASALNHPNIVTIYDIAEHEGTTFIAMELVEGRTLRELVAGGAIPIEQVVEWAEQIADGLAKAHAAGIVHRDIKPANVMVTADSQVKILDFGLAKSVQSAQPEGPPSTATTETQEGLIVGTPHYMSPEQCAGDKLDHRSDQFAFGILVYEMIGGKPPFDGPSARAILSAILTDSPPALKRLRPDVPAELERIIARCLEKDPEKRYPSTTGLANELHLYAGRRTRAPGIPITLAKRPAVVAAIAVVAIGLAAAGWLWSRQSGRRWAGHQALEEVNQLTERGALYEAYRTALRAERYRPADPALTRLLDRMTLPIAVNTEPAGAEVSVKGYATPDAEWERIGVTPMTQRIPYAMMRWRITKAGYEPFEGAPFSSSAIGALIQGIQLDSMGKRPVGTVRVPGGMLMAIPGARPKTELPGMMVEPFFLDRFEVTNRQYREFVDAGGYREQRWWTEPIEREGKVISWPLAMRLFVDPTERPGPSTWEAGTYPAGQENYPVGGISWYEAAAYCIYAGKALPTVYHWFHALGQDQISDILLQSNMDHDAKAPVGKYQGLGAYGTYDMAGNVKEWVWNAVEHDRYILGGGWNEPTYLFKQIVAQDPLGREPTNGVRCAQYPTPPTAALMAPVLPEHQYQRTPPFTREAFNLIRGLYGYDRTPLDPKVERVNDSLANYRRETISFRTAYGTDRMELNLLFPKQGRPPYQCVIWFPGDDVYILQSSATFASEYLFDFIPRGGRVLVYPIYKGMYERFEPPDNTPSVFRDRMIRWAQDLSRTIDYLATRPDFDVSKVGYYGFSAGAIYGPVFAAVEPRIGASILLGGGLIPQPFRPEVDPAAFAHWSHSPTLMINGRDDFLLPFELSQQPLFMLLGVSPEKKRHARLTGGHIPSNRLEIVREVLDWLDKQMGPVGAP